MRQALLVAELHPAQVEHGMLHGHVDALAPAGVLTLEECRQYPGYCMHSGA